jgi:hypothetical protein
VFFSDTGEAMLMSRPKVGTSTPIAAENKSKVSVSDVDILEGFEIDEPALVPANGTALQSVPNSWAARVFGFIHSHTGGCASKKEYHRFTGGGTIGHWIWAYLDKDSKDIIRMQYGGKLEEI